MATEQQDIYSSHPAFSILTSALLPPPQEPSQQKTLNHTSTWNLEADINEFFKLSRYRNDRRKLLRCGITIGLSYLREWGAVNLQSRDLLGDVSRRLLTLFLSGLPSQIEGSEELQRDGNKIQTTRVFIIHPIYSTIFAPETLFKDLLNCQSLDENTKTIPESQALNLLDRVELLPVHDFSSATQAVSQVSDAISNIREQHRRTSVEDSEEDEDGSEESHQPPTTLVIIEGLDTMSEDVIHNSNAMRGSAILTPVLRTLTHLSRTHTSFLSILLVNKTALGTSQQQTQSQQIPSAQTSPSDTGGRTTATAAGGLHSAFARDYTHQKAQHEGQAQQLLHTLLSRTLDQGVDTHLLLQVKRGQTLVEVIKDRTGDGLGKWCVWR